MRLLLLCIVALALCHWSLAQSNCTEDDYKASYTQCSSSNHRDLVYYKKADSNCTGGVPVTPPIYDLPCGIACKPGFYLPMGERSCAPCKPGTFSIGGGYRIDTWYSWPENVQFTRYSHNTTNKTVHTTDGSQWSLESTFIRSGNITHLHASVLELSVYITSPNAHVSFSYRVNAEYLPPFNYDGLQFEVDGAILMSKTSHTSNYVTATYPLKPGAHVLTWSYSKDFSESKGEDAAFIRMIEIAGIDYADDYCTPCLEGTYTSNYNATVCLPCPANTHSDIVGASTCKDCDIATEYSYSEAANCTLRQPCQEDDYETFYTPCEGGHRELVHAWITPLICNANSREGVQLPANEEGLPCGNCTAGTQRNPITYACDYCEDGHYSNATTHGVCTGCPAGTAAVRTFAVTQFDDWVAGSTTDCSGDCSNQGWLLHSTSMNSGIGHGNSVNSWFHFNVTLAEPGILIFRYSIACQSAQCSLSLSVGSDAPVVYSAPKAQINSDPIHLTAGVHSLNWTFSKYDYLGTSRSDAAYIYNIFISSTTVGGAINCTKCANGSYSADNAKQCIPCDAGSQSNEAGTGCVACPAGTFNERAGGVCLPCGPGTAPFPNATGCFITCAYTPENTTTMYNLTHLRTNNSSYGPIKDKNQQNYYINICGTQPHKCYSAKDTPINSYACQETRGKIAGTDVPEGKDIGHVLGWHSLPKNNSYKTNLGVVMSLDYGDYGCNGQHRDTKITFICDPAAGVGAPTAIGTDGLIETTSCHYSFLWRSLYACPICDVNVDMAFYFSPCQEGKRTKTYYWLKNPPLCHGGELPEPVVVNCSETDTVCAPGQYLEDGVNCMPCKAGSYSVGGGERIMSWSKMPARFSSACTAGGACTLWSGGSDGTETISSGNGDSALNALFDYIVNGSISFYYKLYSPNAGKFTFTIDTKEQLDIPTGVSKLGWNHVSIPVPKGVHAFAWTFLTGSEANETTPRVGVVLKEVTIIGTDYHDDACTPCPAGFKSASNASTCVACGLDHYSSAPGSDVCTACPPSSTALHRATECDSRPHCTDADIVTLYTDCIHNNRTEYSAYLQPQFCIAPTALPANRTVSCASCLNGSFPDPNTPGRCAVCPLGEFYSGGKCEPAPAGSIAVKKRFYFVDNSTDTLPQAFTTSCSGDCGTSGWRIIGSAIESGYHGDHAVDSWLRLQVHVIVGFGNIEFNYHAASQLDFYIDGKYITSFSDAGQHSENLAEGTHTITWNYHQHKQANGYAILSDITVTGVSDSDAGSFVEKCPAGSYSAQNSSSCILCAPGTFAATEGSIQCVPCSARSYSSEYGSTECLLCNSDSSSAANAQYCNNENCHYTAAIGARTVFYSLNDTNTLGPYQAQHDSFYFNFCNASLAAAPCNPGKPSHVCAVEEKGSRNWGGYLTFNSTHAPIVSGNTSFQISFAYGDSDGCPGNSKRSTVVKFFCDVKAPTNIEYDSASSDECTAVFEWTGRAGCPVCEDQDYSTLLGQCVDGMRTVQKQRNADCNGEDIVAAPSQSCSGTVEFPIAVVFIVIGVVLVLVAVAVVVFIKNRRITAQYGRLKQQSDHALGMDNDDNL